MLCIHGEVVDPGVDFFEREQVFIADKLEPMLAQVPTLKVVIEHATTREAVAFVEKSQHPGGIGCTITPQHLLYNRNALFNKGLNPHFFCLPILKREEDRLELLRAGASVLCALHCCAFVRLHSAAPAVLAAWPWVLLTHVRERQLRVTSVSPATCAATSGNPRFFAGTDSAPHAEANKLTCCGSAGCFSANAAAALYAEAFDSIGAVDKLQGFLSTNGPAFYGLEPATEMLTLVKEPQTVPVRTPTLPARTVQLLAEPWRTDVPSLANLQETIPLVTEPSAEQCGPAERLVPLRAGQEVQWSIKK
eukprot:COSAG02_NODE_1051_length_14956_cov_3.414216_2_plen_306_part_00